MACTATAPAGTTTPPSTMAVARRTAHAVLAIRPPLRSLSPIRAPIRVAVMGEGMVVAMAAGMAGETAVAMVVVTAAGMVVAVTVVALIHVLPVPRVLTASLARATAAALIPVAAPIPATAAVPAAVVALVLHHLFVAVTKSSVHSFFSSGGLGARLRAWAARSRATRVIAKPRTSAKATRSPALKLMSCGSSCAAPGRGTVTAH